LKRRYDTNPTDPGQSSKPGTPAAKPADASRPEK
jgi:hypothetical protein